MVITKRLVCVFICGWQLFAQEPVINVPPISFDTQAEQAILIDAHTGAELYSKNADQRMAPSSLTKMLTAYIVIDQISSGRLKRDQLFTVSKQAFRFEGSTMFLNINQEVTIDDLLKGLIIVSGNDASIVLAEGISGSEGAFAQVMNQYSKKLGMTHSHFVNASGYPNPHQYSTARDMAHLSKRVITDQPAYYPLYAVKSFSFNGSTQQNRNPLLYRGSSGCDGIKTGYSEAGGYGLAASVKRGNRRLIAVVNGLKTKQQRADAAAQLVDWGFGMFENSTLFKKGHFVAKIPVKAGDVDVVIARLAHEAVVTTFRGETHKINSTVAPATLKAPLNEGDHVGVLHIKTPSGHTYTFPLHAAHAVGRANIMVRGWHWLKEKLSF